MSTIDAVYLSINTSQLQGGLEVTLVSINVVALHRARLVLGWVTWPSVWKWTILAYNQPPGSGQLSLPSLWGRWIEYHPCLAGSSASVLYSKQSTQNSAKTKSQTISSAC